MAIFGWGTTNNTLSDLRLFEAERGLPAIPVTIKYFGAETSITDSIGEVEWDLDTQASTGMAPNAVALKLYFGKAGTDADLVGAYHAWGADKQGPLQGSSSFSGCEEAPGADQTSGPGHQHDAQGPVGAQTVQERRVTMTSIFVIVTVLAVLVFASTFALAWLNASYDELIGRRRIAGP